MAEPRPSFASCAAAGEQTRGRGWLFLLLSLLLFPGPVIGQDQVRQSVPVPELSSREPVVITADTVLWFRQENRLVLRGRVLVVHPLYTLRADKVEADLEHNLLHAEGKVSITREEDGREKEILSAESVDLDLEAGTGGMKNAALAIPGEDTVFRFSAARIEKTGEHTYLIEDGVFTWCDCGEGEKPDWSVSAKKMTADAEGDAVVRGAGIKLKDRQVLKIPYFRYPVGSRRRSGFLFPEVETSSRDGIQIETPYFLVLSRSADLTLGPRWIEQRGVEGGIEFRYNYGEQAAGELRGFFIQDGKEHANRGGVRLLHRTDLGDRFSAAADLAWISDNEALSDFDHRKLGNENEPALESILYLSLHRPNMNMTAEFSTFDDLLGGDLRESPFGEDRDSEMVQRLPELRYTLITRRLAGPLFFDLQAAAANYYREERDLGRGQMVSVLPRLVLPYRFFDAVDFRAAAGYRGWFTYPDPAMEEDSSFLGRPEAELYLSAQWERIFDKGKNRFRHSIRPELLGFYQERPDPEPEDDFFRAIIPERGRKLLGIHLDSRLFYRPENHEPAPTREAARVELYQFYDFDRQEPRDLRIEGRLGPPSPWTISADLYYGWKEWEWTRLTANLRRGFGKKAGFSVGYREDTGKVRAPYFDFQAAKDSALTASFHLRPHERHRLEYKLHYSLEHGRVIRETLDYDYTAAQKCWGLSLRLGDRIRTDEPDRHEVWVSVNLNLQPPPGM